MDKFLKVARIIKRRELAKEACELKMVRINGVEAKAASRVKVGDIIEVDTYRYYIKLRVNRIPQGNVSKKEASELYEVLEERRKGWLE